MNVKLFSAFQRVKQDDGTYAVVLPITTTDEVYTSLQTKQSLTQKLASIDSMIDSNKDTIVEDIITILGLLSSFLPKPISLNHAYVNDLSDKNDFNITSGAFVYGKIFM